MPEVTRLLSSIEEGDLHAAEQLLPLVYEELRRLARARLAAEKPGQTLQATALVHEAYLRLIGGDTPIHWNSRGHFFGAAAEAMRRILVDQARHKKSLRAGGGRAREAMDANLPVLPEPEVDVLALDEALSEFEKQDARAAQLVKLRHFAGLTMPETAEVLGVSLSTAEKDWAYARSWLKLRLSADDPRR